VPHITHRFGNTGLAIRLAIKCLDWPSSSARLGSNAQVEGLQQTPIDRLDKTARSLEPVAQVQVLPGALQFLSRQWTDMNGERWTWSTDADTCFVASDVPTASALGNAE
jgi:hypothetical protein